MAKGHSGATGKYGGSHSGREKDKNLFALFWLESGRFYQYIEPGQCGSDSRKS